MPPRPQAIRTIEDAEIPASPLIFPMSTQISYPSAVYKLPNETLATIFGHVSTAPGQIDHDGDNTLSYRSQASPFALSHVCRHWRNMVLSMPDMWTNFSITKPGSLLVNLVLYWLLRSGDKPLIFGLYQGEENTSFSETFAVLLVLLSHARRWKSIRLQVDCRIELFINKDTMPQPVALESIQVALNNSSAIDLCVNLCEFLHSSPCLTEVSWDNSRVFISLPELQWTNITKLTLHDIQTAHLLLDALSQCERLETLKILGQVIQDLDDTLNTPDVRLPNLRNFAVGQFVEFDDVFVSLTLPSLTKLTLLRGLDSANLQHSWQVVHDLVSRSSCTLTSLTIGKVKAKHGDIYVPNLKAPNFNSLETLCLLFHRTTSEIQFFPSDGKNQDIVVRQVKEKGQTCPKIHIRVPKALGPNSVAKPSDMGCAVRYAFAFNAEHTTQ